MAKPFNFAELLDSIALPPTPLPGPCETHQQLAFWFVLFARDCCSALGTAQPANA